MEQLQQITYEQAEASLRNLSTLLHERCSEIAQRGQQGTAALIVSQARRDVELLEKFLKNKAGA